MCGIAALFAKTSATEAHLGALLADMLEPLAGRGPDSAGAAVFRDPVPGGSAKVSLLDADGQATDWAALGAEAVLSDRGDQAVLHVDDPDGMRWAAEHAPHLIALGAGTTMEVAKRRGRPDALIADMGLRGIRATHALGHTRMATESAVVTAGSHPFSTGDDLCLVHNGSLSNHNLWRARLRAHGIAFQSENDSEVAAGYLQWRLREGDDLVEALERGLSDLDGFYTFAVGTRDGFAVLRDPVACKPALLAETDDWVAMASEFRALAVLPGVEDAEVWEPGPGVVYAWTHAAVSA
ncbi:MAG: glutamine amidotransferase [Solirubrobacterales bacterium]|nr:glutamine amidotransferase [Solirubrobacterales bacterium]